MLMPVQEMLINGATDLFTQTDENGFTPVHYAAGYGHVQLLKTFQEFKVCCFDVNIFDFESFFYICFQFFGSS